MDMLGGAAAQWIGAGACPNAPLFRKTFHVPVALAQAQLYICGLGYYEVHLNGAKLGDHVLDPIVSQYDRRSHVVTYDVTTQLQAGTNAVGVILGNGWYNAQTKGVWNFDNAYWRDHPKLLCTVVLTCEDGQIFRCTSDGSWRVHKDGPIRFNQLRNGEYYDARFELNGWSCADYDDGTWDAVSIVPGPGGLLEEQIGPPCKVMADLEVISVNDLGSGVAVFDFGENIAGWGQLRVSGQAGTEIILRYAERLNEDGSVDQQHIGQFVKDGSFQTDRYILKGVGEEIWEPRFTYHGFRYIQVEGFEDLENIRITGRIVHSAFASIGTFSSSHPDLNSLQECTRRSFVGNFVGIPTDCPHREKNGWTGDAQLAAEAGLMNYDLTAAYDQWLQTMADTQRPSGQFPGIVPSAGWGYNWGSGPAWDIAFLLIPWYVYLYRGDSRLLEKYYEPMKRYVDYCETMATDHIVSFGLGDWCAFDKMPETALTSTGYYYVAATTVAAAARLCAKRDDVERFTSLAANIKAAFKKRFYKGQGIYGDGDGELTALACALYHNLVDEAEKPLVVDALVKVVEARSYTADFGILGSKYVPRALAENGAVETAFKIITQESFPGWVHWLRQGATTLWEDWSGASSQNHVMFGDVSAWMYNYLAGIKPDIAQPGFTYVTIRPHVIEDLDWVAAEYLAAAGTISSAWKKTKGTVIFTISLPDGVSGELVLADGSVIPLRAGRTEHMR